MRYNVKRVATAGVTTAALAVGGGMAAATPAQAMNWDAVARCESGNNWSINTGNGFYGGLQFTRSTWLGFGGGAYAPTANRATKAQQIAIAERVLRVQGPGAWPVCSRKAGAKASRGKARSSYVHSRNKARKAAHKKHKRVYKKRYHRSYKKRYVLKKRYTRSGKRYYVRVYVRR